MNKIPRCNLTPADRDAAAIDAAKLHAMRLRREAAREFWDYVGAALRRLLARHTARTQARLASRTVEA